jgi:hypothetical protein
MGPRNSTFSHTPDELASWVGASLNKRQSESGPHESGGWIRADAENVLIAMPDSLARGHYYRSLRERAKQSIFIMGAGLSQISQQKEELSAQLQKGVNIRILGIDPRYASNSSNKKTINAFFHVEQYRPFSERAKLASYQIVSFIEELKQREMQGRLEYRVFDFIPTTNLTVIDEKHPYASMVYEHILPRNDRGLTYDVSQSNSAFRKLLPPHEGYWESSDLVASSK